MSYEEGLQDKELVRVPSHFEDGITLMVEWLGEINLGTYHHLTLLGSRPKELEKQHLIDLLRCYKDYFAWSYDEMSRYQLKL